MKIDWSEELLFHSGTIGTPVGLRDVVLFVVFPFHSGTIETMKEREFDKAYA